MKSILVFMLLSLWVCTLSSCALSRDYHYTYVNSPHDAVRSETHLQKIYLDTSFGEADKLAIDDALGQWKYALNGYWDYQIESYDMVNGPIEPLQEVQAGNAWIFLKITSNSSILKGHERPVEGRLTIAFVNGNRNSLYLIRDRLDNELVRGTVLHEIGHLLGAEHVDETSDLMNPLCTADTTRCVDQHTLQQVARHLHLPMENLNYCVYLDDKGKVVKPHSVTHVSLTFVDN